MKRSDFLLLSALIIVSPRIGDTVNDGIVVLLVGAYLIAYFIALFRGD